VAGCAGDRRAIPGVDLVAARLEIEPYKVLSATAKTKAKVFGVSFRQAEISRLRVSQGDSSTRWTSATTPRCAS